MWPVIFAGLRTYGPYITFPAACIIGWIGYNLESLTGNRQQGWKEKSFLEDREDRYLKDNQNTDMTNVPNLKSFQPKSILQANNTPNVK